MTNQVILSENEQTQQSQGSKSEKSYYGLKRHRFITAGCALISLAFLGASTLDLRPLLKQDANLDTHFKITPQPTMADLPENAFYDDDDDKELHDGLVLISSHGHDGRHNGFADATGKIVIKPIYNSARQFNEGRAPVYFQKNQQWKWGYIDKTGKLVIPAEYSFVGDFHNGQAIVSDDKSSYLIDINGRKLANFQSRRQDVDVAVVGKYHIVPDRNGLLGLMDSQGNWKVQPVYEKLESFNEINRTGYQCAMGYHTQYQTRKVMRLQERFFKISLHGLCGVIDDQGTILIAPKYSDIISYQNGHAAVEIDNRYGFVDNNGIVVIPAKYSFATAYDDIIAVKDDQANWHFIDAHGNTISSGPVDAVICDQSGSWLSDGLGAVIVNKLCGYVDRTGKFAVAARFDWVRPFSQGYAAVLAKGSWRYIDKTGKFASPQRFIEANEFKDGIANVTAEGPLSFLADPSRNFRYNDKTQAIEQLKSLGK